jgi:hypothetical protein
MSKTKPWNAQIPKTPKFNERKSLYRWVEFDGDPVYITYKKQWLTRAEVTLLILQDCSPELIQV